MRRLLVSALGLALGLASLPDAARACDCPMPAIEVLPRLGTAAPVNTRVWITFPADLRPDDSYALTLRARGGDPVAVERQHVGFVQTHVVVLTPRAPLAPDTRYEVVLAVAGGRPSVVGELKTGAADDRTAPTWSGVSAGRYVVPERACCDCSTGDPYAELTLGHPADDATAASQLFYGVWVSDTHGRIDYDGAPLVYVRAVGGRILLGRTSRCLPANFGFATPARKMRVGVRPVDLAGNQGEPAAITLILR